MTDGSNDVRSEAALVKALQGGDMAAFDRIYEMYGGGLTAYVDGMLGDRALAEDVVQDVFVTLCRKIDRIRPGKGVRGWLYRVARNRTYDMLRGRRREVLGDEAVGVARRREVDESDVPPRRVMATESKAVVEAALQHLPAEQREVLSLRFFADLRFREIARTLRRPLSTVLWQARRAMAHLEKIIVEEDVRGN